MITQFGKIVRKHRIDHGMTLKDLAEVLGKSSAFLSAVETGRKSVPADLVDAMAGQFGLDRQQRDLLWRAAEASKQEVKINLESQNELSRGLAVEFARRFPEMSDDDKADLLRFLKGDK